MADHSMPRMKRRGTPRLPVAKTASAPAHSPSAAAPPGAPEARALQAPQQLDLRQEKTLTVKAAAHIAMKSEDTIYDWLRKGRVKGWQVGGHGCSVAVSATSLEEVLKRSGCFEK